MTKVDSGLWAVTCFFNPVGYRRRLANFKTFRARLSVPLVAVELGYGDNFELGEGDAETLIQLRSRDVMWQKERLLNIGLKAVPSRAEKVAFLDCDIVFPRDDWAELTSLQLDECNLIHLFRNRIDLAPDDSVDALPGSHAGREALSTVSEWVRGQAVDESLKECAAPVKLKQSVGLAWAGRREILDKHGLYDAAILGSGDRLITNAAVGRIPLGERALMMNEAQRAHYRRWAVPFSRSVAGRVGYVDQTVYHLWHGDLRNRAYAERQEGLRPFHFDPNSDLGQDESGCWKWNSEKPELHRYVRDYFASRREDG